MLIISLSTIPPRFGSIGPALEGLLAQNSPADHVVLYIPQHYKRFPDHDGSAPPVPAGVELRRPEVDYGPATKVLHAVKEFGDIDEGRADILFCDDDFIYEPDWAETFLAARAEHPDKALCSSGWDLDFIGMSSDAEPLQPRFVRKHSIRDWSYRKRKLAKQWRLKRWHLERHEKPWRSRIKTSGYIDTFEGLGGVMVQPRFFDDDAFNIPDVVWTVDDIWLSGIVIKNGFPIWAIEEASRFAHTPTRRLEALNTSVIEGANRDQANRLAVQYFKDTYGIWGGTCEQSPH